MYRPRQSQILCGFIKKFSQYWCSVAFCFDLWWTSTKGYFSLFRYCTVQPELSYQAQASVSEGPLPPMKDSEIYLDPVNNSDDSLVFQLDDHIKDFYCRYRDICLSKDTLVDIKKDLPVPQIDFLSPPEVREAIKAPSLSHQIKVLKLMTINFQRFKICHLSCLSFTTFMAKF